jgi:hypothetical protein
MRSVNPGCLLILIGIPLCTFFPVLLWDGWTWRFLCPLVPGIICIVLGLVVMFFGALHATAEEEDRANDGK